LHSVDWDSEVAFTVWSIDDDRNVAVVDGVPEYDSGILKQADIIVPAFEGWVTVSLIDDGNW